MELISLYYFTELAKDMHITQTAERLYVTQQTLSNHIARLENYFGVPLLYRKPKLALTTAGEFVLGFANVIAQEQTNLTDILSDIEQQERGVVRFGASTLRMNICMPHILPQFIARYPKVEIRLTNAITTELVPMVLDGQLDFAVVLSGRPDVNLVEQHLMEDHVYLCVADSLMQQYYGEDAEPIKQAAQHGANVKDFAKLPFCMLNNRLGDMVHECFQEAHVTPWACINNTFSQLSTDICFQRLAASFIPQALLVDQRDAIPEDINIFPLLFHGEPMVQQLSLIRRKDRYLSHFFKFFLDLLFQHYSEVEHTRLGHIAQGATGTV